MGLSFEPEIYVKAPPAIGARCPINDVLNLVNDVLNLVNDVLNLVNDVLNLVNDVLNLVNDVLNLDCFNRNSYLTRGYRVFCDSLTKEATAIEAAVRTSQICQPYLLVRGFDLVD
jgi:hypothetical protein